jgi:hypothetical protein
MIADVIRERVDGDLDLPALNSGNRSKWLRFPCPFCGKSRAAINYALNLFICYHADCRVQIWARHRYADPARYLANRFQFQIAQAVRNTRGSYGEWVVTREGRGDKQVEKWDDLRQEAYQALAGYDQSGQLDQWEADVDGDPDQVDRYVLQALNRDLSNWAMKIVRRGRGQERLFDDVKLGVRTLVYQPEESVEDSATWISWPTLGLRFKEGLTVREIASMRGVSVRTTEQRMAHEMAEARRFYLDLEGE